jgi:transcriptional regulator with XRE-family HTH domain
LRPETLGQHLLARRLVLKLTQEQAATQLNTIREQYERWERDEVQPIISIWPRLIAFLGYYPDREQTQADLVLKARRVNGLSQYEFGRKVMAIAADLRHWEQGKSVPPAEILDRIKGTVENLISPGAAFAKLIDVQIDGA